MPAVVRSGTLVCQMISSAEAACARSVSAMGELEA